MKQMDIRNVPNFGTVKLAEAPKAIPSSEPRQGQMPPMGDMQKMKPKAPVKVINKSKWPLPAYETSGASGMDVKANLDTEQIEVRPGETVLVPTGLYVEILPGLEFQARPRSGMSFKTKMRVSNSPGTIDSCYRGEIKIIMENTGDDGFIIKDGERVAQLVLCPVIECAWEEVEQLSDTDRGEGGFGSTGK